ncbi:hypothetical protein FA13DRAFT_1801014 [Coprinellus micaceus]|uniref:F-box domain-containing protein n=1 Tax=Coprinellus micaceus TaxID=71717 RepID=A0A4Y7SEX4_COPMI|nr:hypothetical protein FA13DRAFT_1801014 [Coprinellus micaceus]
MNTSSPRTLTISKSPSPLIREVVSSSSPQYRVISPTIPSPAQQVLSTAELLAMIVDYFNGNTAITYTTFREQLPTQTDWKRELVPLVCVNKTLSRAAIDVLWETMDSLKPFLAILKSDYIDGAQRAFTNGITAEAWLCFEAYSRHTKVLELDDSDMHLSPCWGLYIVMSPYRPQNWFPSLRHLYMGSASSLAFTIALSPCSSLQHVQIDFDSGAQSADTNSATALTASLSHIVHPVDVTIIQILSTMTRLRNLCLRLHLGGAGKLSALVHLPLETLELDITPSEGDMWDGAMASANLNAKPPPVAHAFSTLRRLTVCADGNGQMIVATVFCPGHLAVLDLNFLYHDDSIQTSLEAPRVLFLYLGWNRGLRNLKVEGTLQDVPGTPHSANSLSDFTPHFLSYLSSLKFLEVINIAGVYLSSPGFIVDILQMLPNFERLQFFRFTPRAPASRPEIWTVPTLDHLYQIPKGMLSPNYTLDPDPPALAHLGAMMLRFTRTPKFCLTILPRSAEGPLTDELVALSLYLHRLFPFLTSVTCELNSSVAQQEIAGSVQLMLFAYHRILAKPTINSHPSLALQAAQF